ncbi:MAG TPA: DUF6496 domain-containing protein [Planctomycetota bacterium]|nr:DUF6496 domain-containing protein [Planctomycetota bacterium]
MRKTSARRPRSHHARRLSPSTRAGRYVKEEIHHAREGKHPVKNAKQAIAIGLSRARKAGIPVRRRKSS